MNVIAPVKEDLSEALTFGVERPAQRRLRAWRESRRQRAGQIESASPQTMTDAS